MCLFNHEEVGSVSSQGAAGATLQNILNWIFDSQNISAAEKFLTLQNSFLISADTAHAFHPNFPQCYEPNHRCFAGEGVALKLSVISAMTQLSPSSKASPKARKSKRKCM